MTSVGSSLPRSGSMTSREKRVRMAGAAEAPRKSSGHRRRADIVGDVTLELASGRPRSPDPPAPRWMRDRKEAGGPTRVDPGTSLDGQGSERMARGEVGAFARDRDADMALRHLWNGVVEDP